LSYEVHNLSLVCFLLFFARPEWCHDSETHVVVDTRQHLRGFTSDRRGVHPVVVVLVLGLADEDDDEYDFRT
jgi:hypothetical protein